MKESWIIYNKTSGRIKCTGRNLDRERDGATRDGSTMLEYLEDMLEEDMDLDILYLENSDRLPDPKENYVNPEFGMLVETSINLIKIDIKKAIDLVLMGLFKTAKEHQVYLLEFGDADDADDLTVLEVYLRQLKEAKKVIKEEVNNIKERGQLMSYLKNRSWTKHLPNLNI